MSIDKGVFSYCLFGSYNRKYYQGFQENVKLIKQYYPHFDIHLWISSDVDLEKLDLSYERLYIKKSGVSGQLNTLYRYMSCDDDSNPKAVFIRDADSRVNERDRFAIDDFLMATQPKQFALIRDHKNHGHFAIMAGCFGMKNCRIDGLANSIRSVGGTLHNTYLVDQLFLAKFIFPRISNNYIVYGYSNILQEPCFKEIPLPHTRESFVGQTIDYNQSGDHVFVYDVL